MFEDKTTSKFTIPHFTFEGCTALKKVYLPEDTKITIGPRAFKNCTSLTKVYGSENIVEIGDAAFSYCKSLKEITLGKNLKTVGEKAFLGCTKLARVNLESTKTAPTFGRKAFSATADGIKFVADKAIAKKVKTNLKNTATKNAKVYSVSYSKV
ncbi:MAG: leucine-rich repeat domain-containing protein [Clostridia bacterium]|nr:leucine-rich repeat domain-containing protein [Clostridia bacterium]